MFSRSLEIYPKKSGRRLVTAETKFKWLLSKVWMFLAVDGSEILLNIQVILSNVQKSGKLISWVEVGSEYPIIYTSQQLQDFFHQQ